MRFSLVLNTAINYVNNRHVFIKVALRFLFMQPVSICVEPDARSSKKIEETKGGDTREKYFLYCIQHWFEYMYMCVFTVHKMRRMRYSIRLNTTMTTHVHIHTHECRTIRTGRNLLQHCAQHTTSANGETIHTATIHIYVEHTRVWYGHIAGDERLRSNTHQSVHVQCIYICIVQQPYVWFPLLSKLCATLEQITSSGSNDIRVSFCERVQLQWCLLYTHIHILKPIQYSKYFSLVPPFVLISEKERALG